MHGAKLSCQMGGTVGRKRKGAEEEDAGDSSESDGRGRGWLEKFSTLKVGPSRHVKVGLGARKEELVS